MPAWFYGQSREESRDADNKWSPAVEAVDLYGRTSRVIVTSCVATAWPTCPPITFLPLTFSHDLSHPTPPEPILRNLSLYRGVYGDVFGANF